MNKLESKIHKDVIEVKKSKKPSVFLGGNCSDNKWRKEIKKEFGDKFYFIDPYDENWEAEDNIYDELAGLLNVDHAIFFQGGKGTRKEKDFMNAVGNDYMEFADVEEIKDYLSDLKTKKTASSSKFDISVQNNKLIVVHKDSGKEAVYNLKKQVNVIEESIKYNDQANTLEGLTYKNVKKVTAAHTLRKAASALIKIAKEGVEYKFSNTQVELPEYLAKKVMDWGKKHVPDEEVFTDPEDPGVGREDEIHVTLFYGINNPDPDEVAELLKGQKKFEVRLGLITAFRDGDKNDVLKIDVESPDMQKLHYLIGEKIKNENSYPTYQPHVTIAYMNKGESDKYIGDDTFKGKTFKVDNIVFSSSDGSKTPIKLK